MATLTDGEKDKLRQFLSRIRLEKGMTNKEARACLNAAFQAIEDTFEIGRTVMYNNIDSATASFGMTYDAQDKKMMVKCWLTQKANRGVI